MPTISQDDFDLLELETPGYFPCYAYRHPENVKLFEGLGPVLRLSRGHILRANGTAHYCYLVLSGIMAGTIHGADDSICRSAYFLEGSLLLEPSALSGLPANVAFKACEPSQLMRIKNGDLHRAMTKSPSVFEAVMQSVARKLNSAHERLRETFCLDVRARIYLMLLGIASTCGEDAGGGWRRISFKVTQQEMSDMLGVNRVTVNNALQYLYDEGLVDKVDGRYRVLDAKGMIS